MKGAALGAAYSIVSRNPLKHLGTQPYNRGVNVHFTPIMVGPEIGKWEATRSTNRIQGLFLTKAFTAVLSFGEGSSSRCEGMNYHILPYRVRVLTDYTELRGTH